MGREGLVRGREGLAAEKEEGLARGREGFSYEVKKSRSPCQGRFVSSKTEVKFYLLFLRNSTDTNAVGTKRLMRKLLEGFKHYRK